MTIERTRQILGKKVEHLSDEDLLHLIEQTDKAMGALFQLAVRKAHEKKKGDTI